MFNAVENNPDFAQKERERLKKWYAQGIVERYLKKNKDSKKIFSFLDGPITANNPMGVHHAWGRTYKDIFQRYYNMKGFRQRFQNGFDCQGLWVEVEVEKELGLRSKKDIENIVPGDRKASIAKFVDLCKDRVKKYAAIQTEQSKRLGYFMDWDNSYFTMADENNYMIWHFLHVCYDNGWIYKGHDCVPWCPRCQTAISQHEMLTEDYKQVVHQSVYFTLPIVSGKYKNTSLLIWTTTPWTIPANVAVGVNRKFTYDVWENTVTKKRIIFIGKDEENNAPVRLLKNKELSIDKYIFDSIDNSEGYIKKDEIKGEELIGLVYDGPFDDLTIVRKAKKNNSQTFHTVVDGSDIVVSTEGTGLLHVAPGAGIEDFKLAKEKQLPVICPIDDSAVYVNGMDFLESKNAKKHPELIIDYLKEPEKSQYFFKTQMYKHRYPACWRCKTELVWKVADEWYIAMDRPSLKASDGKVNEKGAISSKQLTFRQMMIGVAKKIKWLPEFGLERELDWLANMSDWLISKKNRYWGLALPIYECKKCRTFEVIGCKKELKKEAVEGWDSFEGKSPHKPWIDAVKIRCGKCKAIISRIEDVGNPWLDAGIVPFATISSDNKSEPLYIKNKSEWLKWYPADFITESFPGQFKNWFYALIAMSSALENNNPFKNVLGFGTLLAEDGRPMHKSWGNSIEFNQAADKIGVDVMRWMYARQNASENMLFGYKRAGEVKRQFILLLWNIYKYFLEYANLDNYKSAKVAQSTQIHHNILDLWAQARLNELIDMSDLSLKNWNIRAYTEYVEIFVSDISKWYIRRSRDRVWVNSEDKQDKISFYRTLQKILETLVRIIAPVMPFMSEEIFVNITGKESVHLQDWPRKTDYDKELIADMKLVREIVEKAHSARKELRIKLRQPLSEAFLSLPSGKKFIKKDMIDSYLSLLAQELNVKNMQTDNKAAQFISVRFDEKITDDLAEEGKVRELIRQVQAMRKESGLKPTDMIKVVLPDFADRYKKMLQRHVMASDIIRGNKIEIIKTAE